MGEALARANSIDQRGRGRGQGTVPEGEMGNPITDGTQSTTHHQEEETRIPPRMVEKKEEKRVIAITSPKNHQPPSAARNKRERKKNSFFETSNGGRKKKHFMSVCKGEGPSFSRTGKKGGEKKKRPVALDHQEGGVCLPQGKESAAVVGVKEGREKEKDRKRCASSSKGERGEKTSSVVFEFHEGEKCNGRVVGWGEEGEGRQPK